MYCAASTSLVIPVMLNLTIFDPAVGFSTANLTFSEEGTKITLQTHKWKLRNLWNFNVDQVAFAVQGQSTPQCSKTPCK